MISSLAMRPIKTYDHEHLPSGTKQEIFSHLGCVFDFAVPQEWLNDFCKRHPDFSYGLVLGTTVWAYPERGTFSLFGVPVSCCTEVQNVYIEEFWDKVHTIKEENNG
jgi:hypothetical protein